MCRSWKVITQANSLWSRVGLRIFFVPFFHVIFEFNLYSSKLTLKRRFSTGIQNYKGKYNVNCGSFFLHLEKM